MQEQHILPRNVDYIINVLPMILDEFFFFLQDNFNQGLVFFTDLLCVCAVFNLHFLFRFDGYVLQLSHLGRHDHERLLGVDLILLGGRLHFSHGCALAIAADKWSIL